MKQLKKKFLGLFKKKKSQMIGLIIFGIVLLMII